MNDKHPITPSPELVMQWVSLACEYEGNETWIDLATQAAEWGADQELEACCELVANTTVIPLDSGQWLRSRRRPKLPSLREQALQALYRFDDTEGHDGLSPEAIADDFDLIRRALEQLDD